MTHEHEFELAAAAIDFELSPAERRRLDTAIAECSVCAAAAAGYRRDASLLTALPIVDASPTVRLEIERAVGLRRQRTSSWGWALLAAALLAAAVGSAVAIGSYVQDRRLAEAQPSPTVQPSVGPTPSPSVAPEQVPDVIELDPPSGGLANVGPPLARDSSAIVVTDDLRIRSAPFVGSRSVKYRNLLRNGDRMLVLDGPVIGQNYEWYQVAVWRPDRPAVRWPIGWVARAGHDGEVWFEATSVDCPTSPMSIEALLALAPPDRVACFGSDPLDVRAVVGHVATDCDPARDCVAGPAWLATTTLRGSISAAGAAGATSVPIALDPASGLTPDDLTSAGVVRLTGAFDGAAARSCTPDPDRVGSDGPIAPLDAIVACRERFVVTAMTAETFPPLADAPAKTVSDRLRVRSLPTTADTSLKYEPLLALETRLTVLDGPVLGDGYAWYHVVARLADGTTLTGWVAAAGRDGERWVKATGPSGAASPTPSSFTGA